MEFFNLEMRIAIRRVDHEGRTVGGSYPNPGLDLSQSLTVQAKDFLEVCEILAQFHQLAERLAIHNPNPKGR